MGLQRRTEVANECLIRAGLEARKYSVKRNDSDEMRSCLLVWERLIKTGARRVRHGRYGWPPPRCRAGCSLASSA